MLYTLTLYSATCESYLSKTVEFLPTNWLTFLNFNFNRYVQNINRIANRNSNLNIISTSNSYFLFHYYSLKLDLNKAEENSSWNKIRNAVLNVLVLHCCP